MKLDDYPVFKEGDCVYVVDEGCSTKYIVDYYEHRISGLIYVLNNRALFFYREDLELAE